MTRKAYLLPIAMSMYKGNRPHKIVKCWGCPNFERNKTIVNMGECRVHMRKVHRNGHCYEFEVDDEA